MPRSSLARPLVALALLALTTGPGCGPPKVENSETIAETGALDEVGQLYQTSLNAIKKPPTSLSQLAAKRDLFLLGYNAIESGKVIIYWGVTPTPDTPSDEVLAYGPEVPTEGGPVLLKDMTIKPMTPEEFQAAPKPSGPTSAKAAKKP